MNFDDYLTDEHVKELRITAYGDAGKKIRF
jgi:hypothetical protein